MKYSRSDKFVNATHQASVDNINYNISRMRESNPSYSAGEVSDGHHTFNELYHHRAALFAALCKCYPTRAWRARRHHDEENDPMFPGMFMVGIDTDRGPIVYHYDLDPYWELFDGITTFERAPMPYDGATPDDSFERLGRLMGTMSRVNYVKIRNEFTEACDEYLIPVYADDPDTIECGIATEFYVDSQIKVTRINGLHRTMAIPFRFPGATRGHILMDVNSGKVTEVKFYPDTAWADGIGCYKPSVVELEERFRGHYFHNDSGLLFRSIVCPEEFTYWDSTIRPKLEED